MASGVHVRCGCWSGDLAAFRAEVAKTHGESGHAEDYLALVDIWARKHQRMLIEMSEPQKEQA
jgi:hypothetical protein